MLCSSERAGRVMPHNLQRSFPSLDRAEQRPGLLRQGVHVLPGSGAGGLSYSGRRRSAIRRSVRRPARVYPFLFAESVALSVDRRFPVVELRTGDALALCEARKRRATAGLEQEPATAVLRDGRTRSLSFLGPRSTCPDLSPERSGRRSRMPRQLSFTSFAGTAGRRNRRASGRQCSHCFVS